MKEVFITYRWKGKEHITQVLSFVESLRKQGYEAEVDQMLSQKETAIDFMKMMHKGINDYKKVIIVLSKGYKERADKFEGGVGTEYNLIIKDIEDNPNKYILVSFDEINEEIIPLSFKAREILELRKPKDFNKLHSKLQDKEIIHFSNVGPKKPEVESIQIPKLKLEKKKSENTWIEVENGVYKDNTGKFHLNITDIEFFKQRHAYFTTGKKGLIKIDGSENANDALSKILRSPITFDTYKKGGISPIYWSRGTSTGKVERAKKISDSIILINKMELKLKSIYLFADYKDKNRFVYAEFVGLEQTIINSDRYEKSLANYKKRESDNYVYEMYGIHNNQNYTLYEVDDGFAKRGDKTIDITKNIEIRERFLTPYNILIFAYDSPLNESSKRYKREYQRIMDEILLEEGNIQDYLPEILELMNRV